MSRRLTGILLVGVLLSIGWARPVIADVIFPKDFDVSSLTPGLQTPRALAARRVRMHAAARRMDQENRSSGEVHFQLAKELAASEQATQHAWEIVLHLELSLAGRHEVATCHASLGQIYLAAGDFSSAERHLTSAASTRPKLRLSLARAKVGLGKIDEARREAELARAAFERLMKSAAPGSAAEIQWLATLEFLEEFEPGVKFLKQRLRNGAGEYARKALSRLYVSWYDVGRRQTTAVDAAAIDRLLSSLHYEPEYRPAMERLVKLLVDDKQPPSGRNSLLMQSLRDPALTAHEHLVVGTIYFQKGLAEEAVSHLQKAYEQDPEDPAVLNNLAWILAKADPPQLDQALEIANRLIDLVPDRTEFRETRGQIHVLRQDWTHARSDLEAAEQALPNHEPLHRALVIVYEAISMPREAGIHREISGRLSISAE